MKHTFEMEWDQVDAIVISELKDAYERNRYPEKIECSDDYIEPDDKLLSSIETVLEYFMPASDFGKWKDSLK
jgi:hypothetical protein